MPRRFSMLIVFIFCLIVEAVLGQVSEPILVGVGTEAKWSPDEKAISFLRGDSLYIKYLTPDKPAQGIYYASIVTYEWLDDSTIATYEKEYFAVKGGTTCKERIAKVPLHGLPCEIAKDSLRLSGPSPRFKRFQRFADGSVGYFDRLTPTGPAIKLSKPGVLDKGSSDSTKPTLFVGTVPISWGKVWLYYGSEFSGRQVTPSDNYYQLPRIAPTCDKFMCFSGRGDLVVFDTLGNELSNLGRADVNSWNPDGKYIVFCVTKEAGDPGDIVESDVFIAKWDGSEKRQITNTIDVVELDPSFSPSSSWLLYCEYPSDRLFVIRIN